MREFLSGMPMCGSSTPDGLAAATELLLSDDAGFIMGQALFVKRGTLVGKVLL